ncbi:MAG: bifunctional [glutamine synthetase] adenylyltransferase/[glutamine synthetase]-adenylyl-L-tyrosine phosphorylase [Acidimicrobiales bacterium]
MVSSDGPAVMARELAELVEWSADPAWVRVALERLVRRHDGLTARMADDERLAVNLVTVVAASHHVTELLADDALALEVIADPSAKAPVPADMEEVVRWSRRELLRIAVLDLTGAQPLAATTSALSGMARGVLAAALRHSVRDGIRMSVIGMGKLGGDELNYASDVDILLVGEGDPAALERAGRTLLDLAGRCFRVDADLRPEGRDGPLVRSIRSYRSYWERWADPWERQALLRAVPVAGDAELGQQWLDAARHTVWGQTFSAEDLRYVRAMKVRAEEEVRRRGVAEREVKRGPGGIRDIEFAAQLLQLVHGPVDMELRSPNTLVTLAALAAGGYVDRTDAEELADSYTFLRRVEHGLQLVDGRQTHTLPEDRAARRHVARVLGYRGNPEGGPTELFDRDHAFHRGRARRIHERVWFRPLLDALSGAGPLGPEAAASRLTAFGFTDVERTRQAVVELTRGLTRSSRMMQQLLPLLLGWLSSAPDPDLGLLGLRRLASGEQGARTLATVFRDSPEVARDLALLLGTSRRLGDILVANPDLTERLPHPDRLQTVPGPQLVASALSSIAWREDPDDRQRALQRWQQRHLFGIASRDALGYAGLGVVGADLTALAEASLEAALTTLGPKIPFAVVAFGRLGGAELGYASDLDIAFVYDGGGSADAAEAERVASGLLRFVGGDTPAERIWEVDTGLRPEGRNGPLARSLEGWRAYLARWASTWERQAYLRARAVAGTTSLGDRLVRDIDEVSRSQPFTAQHVREVRRMKVRIEQERIGRNEDPEFHLKLGRGSLSDIEFTVQLLQLRTGVRGTATMGALQALVDAGHLPATDAEVLEEAYRFCEHTRNRRFLVVGSGDSLPMRPEQATPLARSLGFTVAGLRDEYRRVTRRARRVVERCFYDRP